MYNNKAKKAKLLISKLREPYNGTIIGKRSPIKYIIPMYGLLKI